MKKRISVLFIIPMIVGLMTGCKNEDFVQDKIPTIHTHTKYSTVPAYNWNSGSGKFSYIGPQNNCEIHFFNNSKIPYVEISNFNKNFIDFGSYSGYIKFKYQLDDDGNAMIVNTKRDSYVTFNYEEQTVTFYHYYNFFTMTTSYRDSMDFLNDNTYSKYFKNRENIISIPGEEYLNICLKDYDLKMFKDSKDNATYIPLHAANILLLREGFQDYLYNGHGFYYNYSNPYDVADNLLRYSEIRKKSSILTKEYMKYNYDIIALTLDLHFNVEYRDMRSTGEVKYFKEKKAYELMKPYKNQMLSLTPNESNKGVTRMMSDNYDDGGHTGYHSADLLCEDAPLTYLGEETTYTNGPYYGISRVRALYGMDPATITGNQNAIGYYEEYDDIAYIYFKNFFMCYDNIRASDVTENNYFLDTTRIFIYANRMIKEHGIKKVIIDLSDNGGGEIGAGAYVISWVCGGTAKLHLMYGPDKYKATYTVHADLDLDGKVNENDYLSEDTQVYCMVSNGSFSCANLTPCMFAEQSNTKFIGSRSGGGSCSVNSFAQTPIGGSFRMTTDMIVCHDDFTNVEDGVTAEFMQIDDHDYEGFLNLYGIIDYIKENE